MSAGAARTKIRIEESKDTFNAFNEPIKAWTSVGEYGVEMEALNGAERYRAMQVTDSETVKFTFRYSSSLAGLTTAHRFVDVRSGLIYDLKAVLGPNSINNNIIVMATQRSQEFSDEP